MTDRQQYHGDPTAMARSVQHGNSGTYIAPEIAGPDHGEPLTPLAPGHLVVRVVVSALLAAIGLFDLCTALGGIVVAIVASVRPHTHLGTSDSPVALVVLLLLAAALLTYPVINVVRWARWRRARS